MPRSPLMRQVRQALHLSLAAQRAHLDDDHVLELRGQHFQHRRMLVRAGAASGAALGLAACGVGPGTPAAAGGDLQTLGVQHNASSVVIVGAGIAGLTAGYRLRQAGVKVSIYEASGRVGGRMLSLPNALGIKTAELGGEFIDSGHVHIRRLAAELGLALNDNLASDASLTSQDRYEFGGRIVSTAEVIRAFQPLAERITLDLTNLNVDTVSYKTPGNGGQLDRTSISQYLRRAGVSGFLYDLLDVAYTTEYGLDISEQSCLNLLYLIGTDPGRFDIFGVSDEQYTTALGNGSIPQRLAQRLTSDLSLGQRLSAVTERKDGRYALTFTAGGRESDVLASQVILTLPFALLRQVDLRVKLPPAKRRAIAQLSYGTNAKLIAGFTERVWRTRYGCVGGTYSDLGYQQTWESSRASGTGPAGLLTNFVGGRRGIQIGEGSPEAQTGTWLAQIEQLFPGIRAARNSGTALRAHWPSNPYSLGSYSAYRPGDWTGFSGAEGEAVGGLHFAGEHTSSAAQGYMEGGCESGERAATEVLSTLGITARTPRSAQLTPA